MGVNRMPLLGEAGIHTSSTAPKASPRMISTISARPPSCAGSGSLRATTPSVSSLRAAPAMRWRSGSTRGAALDLWDVDIRRAQPFQKNRFYLRERVSEIARPALRRPLALPPAGDRARCPPLHRARAPARQGRRLWRNRGLGTGELVCARRSGTGIPLRLGPSELVRQRPRGTQAVRERLASSTCRPLAKSGSRAPMPWPSCRRSAPTTSTLNQAKSSTRRCSMAAAGSRAT